MRESGNLSFAENELHRWHKSQRDAMILTGARDESMQLEENFSIEFLQVPRLNFHHAMIYSVQTTEGLTPSFLVRFNVCRV